MPEVDEWGFYESVGQHGDHVGRSRDQSINDNHLQDGSKVRQPSRCELSIGIQEDKVDKIDRVAVLADQDHSLVDQKILRRKAEAKNEKEKNEDRYHTALQSGVPACGSREQDNSGQIGRNANCAAQDLRLRARMANRIHVDINKQHSGDKHRNLIKERQIDEVGYRSI